MVDLDAPHKIMLCRHDRNTFLMHIIAHLPTMLNNIWKMGIQFLCRDLPQVFPDIVRTIFFHLLADLLGQKIPRQKFIDKTVAIFVI